jgi:hypothetical protein
MVVAHTVLGLAMLLFGRKLFWLFVGAAGFLAGSRFGALAFAGHPPWLVPVIAVACGLAGVVIALVFQRVAFAAAGFFAGVYLLLEIALQTGLFAPSGGLLLLAGAAGAVLAAVVMDWAIVWLSCLVGAGAIVWAIGGPPALRWGLWIVLSAAGVVFQTRAMGTPDTRRKDP